LTAAPKIVAAAIVAAPDTPEKLPILTTMYPEASPLIRRVPETVPLDATGMVATVVHPTPAFVVSSTRTLLLAPLMFQATALNATIHLSDTENVIFVVTSLVSEVQVPRTA
jgi:hypothetical protein